MSASVWLPRPDQGLREASSWPAKLPGAQLSVPRLVPSRGQSPEVPDLARRQGQPAEPLQVFCMESSDRVVWMPDSSVMLRTVSVRKGITPLAGARKVPGHTR